MRTIALGLGACVLFGAGCGGGQTRGSVFDPSWSDDGGAAIGAFQQRFAATPVPTGASVAVGFVDHKAMIGVPLEGGKPWRFEHALDVRPDIAGSVVVGIGGGELFALDAMTGALLWKRSAGGQLRGAGDDGRTTVVSLFSTTGRGSTVLAITHDGQVVRQLEDPTPIGVPAVVDGFAFLPWQGQYVSIYDLVHGEETARVLLRSHTSRAFTLGGAVFFGEIGATRFDDKIRLGAAGGASTIMLPARELPGTPRWMAPGTEVSPPEASAPDKIRLYARPSPKGEAVVAGGRYAATYYRIAVGLDAKSGEVGWAHAHDVDLLGGAAYDGGFAFCDGSGKVTLLDAQTGAVAGEVSLGGRVDGCEVQADAFTKRASGKAPALAEQLASVVMMPEPELAMMQKLLLREVSGLADESITKALIDLASNERTPPLLVEEGRKAIAARRNGQAAMLDALGKHFDYLAGVLRPPPVGPIADALAAMKETRGAPLLAAHLNDPADSLDDAQRAAAALGVLAGKDEVAPLAIFFGHYRAAASEDALVEAVTSVARALVRNGAGAIVAAAAADPLTTPAVKDRLGPLAKGSAPAKPEPAPKAATPKPLK